MSDISDTIQKMRNYFNAGTTISYSSRIANLDKLKKAINKYEDNLIIALHEDLGKSPEESYISEISIIKGEIKSVEKHLYKFMKKRRVSTPLIHFPAESYRINNPLGLVLIMSPWNYPVQLTLSPLIAAIAAGNCVVLKPSRYSSSSSSVIKTMIEEFFDENFITTFEGGSEMNQALLDEKFDLIFFTGSPMVGHIVMEKASKNLTPIVLELGGKSPVYIDSSADIELTAQRIAWAKYLNAGQTCVAPDYVLVHKDVYMPFVTALKNEIINMYGINAVANEEFPKIINEKHFNRLLKLLQMGTLVHGGEIDKNKLKIAPSVLISVNENSPLMQEEIFGPILPVMQVESFEDAMEFINHRAHPLALYIFTKNQKQIGYYENNLAFGGGCINDCIIHLSNPNLPFGGIGDSGMGSYHGKTGLETFSHSKSIMKRHFFFDIKLRNPPLKGKLKQLKFLLK
ncbi:MAG: aldehyde dehydrogenase family protein [Spirochaetaceae bacterium]|nr:aldehyde dehydrogenase family protein [Spirochaetaceae bacterium]